MRYVKRDEIIKAVKEAMCPMDYPSELRDSIARTIVSAAESIDVVHCSECKYYQPDGGAGMICSVTNLNVDDDDYCSYGEREEDNEQQGKGEKV